MSKKPKIDITDVQGIDAALANLRGTPPLAGQAELNRGAAKDRVAYATAAHQKKNTRPTHSPVRSPAEIAAAGRDAAHKLRDTRDIENASTAVLMAIDDLRAALADFDRIAAERRQLARAVAAAAYPAHTSVAGQVAQQLADLATFSAMKRPHFRNQILRAAASVIQNADGLMDMQDRSAADEIERVKDHLAHRLQQLLPAEELA